jgi:hypothetical protein
VRQAFDLEREPAAVRENYGKSRHGQTVLLARRLIEAGACFVSFYRRHELQDWGDRRALLPANSPWDTHRNHCPLLKNELLRRADRALAALVDDLAQRGRLGETLVVWMGDLGRTLGIDLKYASRDHWADASIVLLAGAGTPGGAVLGRTDAPAGEVTDGEVTPAHLTATIIHHLGFSPQTTIHDPQSRSYPIAEGRPVRSLIA